MTFSNETTEDERLHQVALGTLGRDVLKHPDVAPYAEALNQAWFEHRRRWSASSEDSLEGALARLAGAILARANPRIVAPGDGVATDA